MHFGFSEDCLDHDPGNRHPDSPDRLRAIRRTLADRHDVEYTRPDPADRAAMASVHDPDYLDRVREFCESGGGQWEADTAASDGTWNAVRASAGGALWAARTARAGTDARSTPFSLGRPPGHHAVHDDAMGFCFVNNVAVAAEAALGDGGDRVAIVDFDVHHGNGTQEHFYDRGDTLFVSLHEKGLYPGTGAEDETGSGDGAGTTLNVPLPAGAGDPEYLAVLDRLVAPAVADHDPDLLLVSAGFDAHRDDPISRICLSTDGYGLLADRLQSVATEAGVGLAFVLEGGYSLDALAESVARINDTMGGYAPASPEEDSDDVVESLVDRQRERIGLE